MPEFSPTSQRLGLALVLSGPSGTGKSTLAKRLLAECPGLHFSVSCTTRSPRPGEVDGKDYFFVSREEFDRRIANDAFLEHAEVHGRCYGTLREEVRGFLMQGMDVLLDIDVQGGEQVRHLAASDPFWNQATAQIFIGPPSLAELERRLRGRGTEDEEVVRRRLGNAVAELSAWVHYDYLVVNDDLETAYQKLRSLLMAERCRVRRLPATSPWGAPAGN